MSPLILKYLREKIIFEWAKKKGIILRTLHFGEEKEEKPLIQWGYVQQIQTPRRKGHSPPS